MDIKDIIANKGNIDITAEVLTKEEPRTFEKFGKTGRVCSAKVKDHSGEVILTLWNDDIDKINPGDKIHLQNGWCSEFRGEKQLSSGKFGKIEVLESGLGSSASPKNTAAKNVKSTAQPKADDEDDDDDGDIEEEVL